MVDLPRKFLERMRVQLGESFERFIESYENPPAKAIRVNTLKISPEDFEKISPLTLDGKVPWAEGGYFVSGEGLGKTILHAAGLYYVQEPSATCVAPKLGVKAGERVLDLCSAPGGKGTQLAQYMQGDGILVLNEIDFDRNKILRSNAERLGVKNAVITCASPEKLSEKFVNYFDKILVDAPCSGEGMFKKEPNAIPEWSEENVLRCAARQAKILDCADKMLAGGGRLVYSTCTFAPEEDEEQIESFLNTHAGYALSEMKKLYPHEVRGEGHFYAVLQKPSGERRDMQPFGASNLKLDGKAAVNLYKKWESETLNIEFGNLFQTGDKGQTTLYSLPEDMPSIGYGVVRAGVCLATVNAVNGKVEPAHALAMCLNKDRAKCIEVDEKTALNYLKGLTFDCNPEEKGWRLVTYLGYPLGWCKAVNGVAKNHYPKGLRI